MTKSRKSMILEKEKKKNSKKRGLNDTLHFRQYKGLLKITPAVEPGDFCLLFTSLARLDLVCFRGLHYLNS